MINSISDFKNTLNYFAPITDDDTSKVITISTTNTINPTFVCPLYCYNDGLCNFVSLDTGATIKSCNVSSPTASCIGNITTQSPSPLSSASSLTIITSKM